MNKQNDEKVRRLVEAAREAERVLYLHAHITPTIIPTKDLAVTRAWEKLRGALAVLEPEEEL
jgi:hypothetical protein